MGKGGQRKPFIVSEEHKDLLSGKAYGATLLAPEDAWIAHLDHEKFREDVHAIGKTLSNNQGKEDLRHLSKIVWMSRLCQWIGFATMWYCVNPISIFFLSMDSNVFRISFSLFRFNMYANFATFLHFLLHAIISFPFIWNFTI